MTVLRASRRLFPVIFFVFAVCLTAASSAQTFKSIYSFTGGEGGAYPLAALAKGSDGALYGTTHQGGAADYGTIFRITTAGGWTALHAFAGPDGYYPQAQLIQASDGYLYGAASAGGTYGAGTLFKISTSGSFYGVYDGYSGLSPAAPNGLVQAANGDFFGTTSDFGTVGKGTVFRLTSGGVYTTIFSFTGPDGDLPQSSLLLAADGNLYGTTNGGGANGKGTVFKITPDGAHTLLHSFNGTDGYAPYYASLIQGADGYLYGATFRGGTSDAGTVFRITTAGSFLTIHHFDVTGGAYPNGLVQAADGNLYGTTQAGGDVNGDGVIFQISAGGVFNVVHPFSGKDGRGSYAALVRASDGNLYGTTTYGGAYNFGTVFQLVLVPPALKTLILTPASVVGSLNATGTVTMSAAGDLDFIITLSNTDAAATIPASVTIPAGALTATFPITTTAVTANTTGYVKASYKGKTLSKLLTVKPIGIQSLALKPSTVAGSLTTTGTVTLQAPAAPGDIVVSLSSSNTSVANPAVNTITIPAGALAGTFTVNTSAVASKTAVSITASTDGTTKSSTFTVRPIGLKSLTLTPSLAKGGSDVTGKITLEAAAAPGDIVVTLSSNSPSLAPVPTTVTVLAGSLSAMFTIRTGTVVANTAITITATANSTTKTAKLILTP